MIICDDPKFIYIHIPRTGGTSTRAALREYTYSNEPPRPRNSDTAYRNVLGYVQGGPPGCNNVHWNLSRCKEGLQLLSIDWDSYFTWTRVRNPWERIASIYDRRKRATKKGKGMPFWTQACNGSFEDWLDIIIKRDKNKARNNSKTNDPLIDYSFNQRHYVENEGLDFVARFENIDKDFSLFCNKVSLPDIKLPKLNGFKPRKYKEYYNKQTIDKLLNFDKFRKELDYLGYDDVYDV